MFIYVCKEERIYMYNFLFLNLKRFKKLYFEIKYRNIMKDNKFYVVLCNSIGDIITGLGCIHNLKKLYPGRKICVICSETKKIIVDLYKSEYDEVMYIDNISLQDFYDDILLELRYKNKFLLVRPGSYFKNDFEYIKYYKNVNLIDFIKYSIFQLEDKNDFFIPDVSMLSSEKYKIEKKSVILCPYANSIKSLKAELFEKFAKNLSDMGYDVYTNTANEDEKEIKGTKKLCCTFTELIAIANDVGVVIGLRSGILDWLLLSTAKIIAVYPDEEMMSFYDIGALSDIKEAYQYCLSGDDETDINELIKIGGLTKDG